MSRQAEVTVGTTSEAVKVMSKMLYWLEFVVACKKSGLAFPHLTFS